MTLALVNIYKCAHSRNKTFANVKINLNDYKSEIEILYSLRGSINNILHFISGDLDTLVAQFKCIYIPIEINKNLEIRTFYEPLSNFINDKMEKELMYYYDTSMKNKVFYTQEFEKTLIYSIVPFSYEISEVENEIQENYYKVAEKCNEAECDSVLLPIKITERINISPNVYMDFVIKPVIKAMKTSENMKIYLFHENERLLWKIIDLIK